MRLLLLLILVLLAGCNADIADESKPVIEVNEPQIAQFTVLTDKDLYHSKEELNIQVKIDSRNDLKGLQLAVYGIETGGRPRMSTLIPVNLTKGENTITYSYLLPSCNTCSGIKAGDYQVHAELFYENIIVIESIKNISIEQ